MASWAGFRRRCRFRGDAAARMALTGRAALVALAGVVVVLLAPMDGITVLIVLALVVAGAAVDLVLAVSPRAIALARSGDTSTRVGEPAAVTVVLNNPTGRLARGWVRDAWPPSAAASPRVQRID